MMALAIAGTLVSGVISAVGAINAAESEAQAAQYNEAIAKRNRDIVNMQTDAEVQDKQRENRRQLASVRAAYGGSGLSMEGSPLDVLEDTAIEQELDVERVRYSGRVKAVGLTDEMGLQRLRASSARSKGAWGAASAIVGGVTQAASMAYRGGSLLRAA